MDHAEDSAHDPSCEMDKDNDAGTVLSSGGDGACAVDAVARLSLAMELTGHESEGSECSVQDEGGSLNLSPDVPGRVWTDAVRHGENMARDSVRGRNRSGRRLELSFGGGEGDRCLSGGLDANNKVENTRQARKRGPGGRRGRRGAVVVGSEHDVSAREVVGSGGATSADMDKCRAPAVLHEMFIQRLNADIIDMVYLQVGRDVERVIEVLLELSEAGDEEGGVSKTQLTSTSQCAGTPTPADPEPTEAGDGRGKGPLRKEGKGKNVAGVMRMDEDAGNQGGGGEGELNDARWDTLPDECKLMIFTNLSPRESARASLVSKDFAAYSREFRSRTTFLAPPRWMRASALPEMVAAFPNLRTLSLKRWGTDRLPFRRIFVAAAGIPLHHPRCQAQMQLLDDNWFVTAGKRSLGAIDLRNCQHLRDDDVATLCRLHTELESIDLTRCDQITDACLKHLSRFRRSEVASVKQGSGYRSPSSVKKTSSEGSPFMQKNRGLSTEPQGGLRGHEEQEEYNADEDDDDDGDDEELREGAGSERLASVPSRRNSRRTSAIEAGFGRVAKFPSSLKDDGDKNHDLTEGDSPGLRSLCMKDCCGITDKGLKWLFAEGTCKDSLTSLDVSGCVSLTHAGLQIPGKVALRRLRAMQLPHLKNLPMSSLPSRLRELYLDTNRCLEELCFHGPILECLSVTNCPKLQRLQVNSPLLSQLNVASCSALRGIREFHCPALRKMNAFMCRMLTRLDVETIIVDSIDSLLELKVSGCHGIDALNLRHQKLTSLEVQGCDGLLRVNADSKVLVNFDARGCNNLVEVRLESGSLRQLLLNNCVCLRTLWIPVWSILDACRTRKEDTASASNVAMVTKPSPRKVKKEGKKSRMPRSKSTEYLIHIDVNGCNLPRDVEDLLLKLRVCD